MSRTTERRMKQRRNIEYSLSELNIIQKEACMLSQQIEIKSLRS